MSTERSVIKAMKRTPNTSHTSEEDQSADPGARPKTAAVSPHVDSVPATTRTAEWTTALAMMNAVRETGLVSTRTAVPLFSFDQMVLPKKMVSTEKAVRA